MVGMLLLTAFLIFANGFFVAAEFALVKVRSTQLEVEAAEGSRMAGMARAILDHLDGYLSATQLGITLTSLGLGWVGEPAVAKVLGPVFHAFHLPEDQAHMASVAIGFTLISFLHIVVGEVAPKSLAIARPAAVSKAVAWPMRAFYLAFYPALIVLNASSNLLLRMVGVEPAGTHSLAVPADELQRIAQDSVAEGQLSNEQGSLLDNVFTFSTRRAHEIMVPRSKMDVIDLQKDRETALRAALETGHSRYPLVDGDADEIIGILHLKDLLPQVVGDAPVTELTSLARPALFVPETLPAEKLMRLMQRQRTHLAVVLDEHGSVAGVVSLEDALEELVGDIQDEYDQEHDDLEPIEGGFAFEGGVMLREVCEALDEALPQTQVSTLQGFLMEQLERLPKPGDVVRFGSWEIRVMAMERRSVLRAEARKSEAPPEPEAKPAKGH